MSTLKKAVLYCRVSTKEQVEEGNSLISQERICRSYAEWNSYQTMEIFIEKGESAKTAKIQNEIVNLADILKDIEKQPRD